MRRRDLLLIGVSAIALAGCPDIPVKVELPPELTQLIGDVNGITGKLSSAGLPSSLNSLLKKAEGLASSIASSSSVKTAAGFVKDWAPIVEQLVGAIPQSQGTGTTATVVNAIITVLPEVIRVAGIVAPLFLARRATGMSLAQARAVLRS